MLLHGWQTVPSSSLHATTSTSLTPQGSHFVQLAAPASFAKLVLSHASQRAAPDALAAVAGLHCVSFVEPVLQ